MSNSEYWRERYTKAIFDSPGMEVQAVMAVAGEYAAGSLHTSLNEIARLTAELKKARLETEKARLNEQYAAQAYKGARGIQKEHSEALRAIRAMLNEHLGFGLDQKTTLTRIHEILKEREL